MKYYISALIISIIILSGCEDQFDMELQQSVFIEDAEYPGLPEYSEWAYNTFGAYYDRQPFTSYRDNRIPIKIISDNSKTTFTFYGTFRGDDMDLTLTVNDTFLTYADLTSLDGKVYNLNDSTCNISIKKGGVEYNNINPLYGSLFQFKRVQDLSVDDEDMQIIISGVFQFQAVINNEPFTVSSGRFDLGIGYDNFYRF